MATADIKKQQKEYIIVAILVVVAFFIGINRFKKKGEEDEVFSRKEFNERWKEIEILEAEIPREEKGIDYTVDAERIPFKSPFDEIKKVDIEQEDITLPVMTFQGMIWNSIRPQAIINDKVYDVDDVIYVGVGEDKEKIKVKDIKKDGIHLLYKRKEFIIRPK